MVFHSFQFIALQIDRSTLVMMLALFTYHDTKKSIGIAPLLRETGNTESTSKDLEYIYR